VSDLPPNGLRLESSGPPPGKDKEPQQPRQNRNTQINLIVASLEKTYNAIGLGLMLVNPTDAQVIAANAGELAESWRSLLETNTKVRASFMKLLESSGWSTVIMAHLMVALPIVKNHGASFEHLKRASDKRVQTDRVAESPTAPTF